MKLCRVLHQGQTLPAVYWTDHRVPALPDPQPVAISHERTHLEQEHVLPLGAVAQACGLKHPQGSAGWHEDTVLSYLPPYGPYQTLLAPVWEYCLAHPLEVQPLRLRPGEYQFLTPWERVPKLILIAANYAEHAREQGRTAAEASASFPHLFLKPPSTTLTPHRQTVYLPAVEPVGVDWEVELGVVVGAKVKQISPSEALSAIAGYTVVNDLSHRKYRPVPNRRTRERDPFFDWQHGKWFDGFCPVGPCITSASAVDDPQDLSLRLWRNEEEMQSGRTSQMTHGVAEILAFASQLMTLEPGDLICTGTPAGVGHPRGQYLAAGDLLTSQISGLGTLITQLAAEPLPR